MTDEQFNDIVERLDRIEAAVEILVGMASPDGAARPVRAEGDQPADIAASEPLDMAELLKHQVRGWD